MDSRLTYELRYTKELETLYTKSHFPRLRCLLPHSPQIVSKKQIVDQVRIVPVFVLHQLPTKGFWTNLSLLLFRPCSISRPWPSHCTRPSMALERPLHCTPQSKALKRSSPSLPEALVLKRPPPSLLQALALALFPALSNAAITSLVALLYLVVWPSGPALPCSVA